MGEAIFQHDEKRNHIYNLTGIQPEEYGRIGKDYFTRIDGEFAAGFVHGDNVVLARDWPGSVPFHYMITSNGDVLTANDIKTLMQHPEYHYSHVRAVRAGHVVTIPLKGRFTEKDVREERYSPSLYDMPDIEGSIEELGREIRSRLVSETEKRLNYATEAAVAFSGGVDSFSVALAIRELGRIKDVEAFCINTEGQGVDWPNAQQAAKYLELKLNEVRASKQETIEIIPKVIYLAELYHDYDLFCAVACYLLGEAMKKSGAKNVFTGDGANEGFRDYTKWGCSQTEIEEIIESREKGLRYFEGRKDSDPEKSPQQGSGYGKSASRGSKVFPYFGLDTFNPFVARSVAAYIARIPLKQIGALENGQPLWKQKIMQAAFPDVPPELFPLKTRMQDGVGTTDVICGIRRSDLIKYGHGEGFAKYGRGATDAAFLEENERYYTDLFHRYFDSLFISKKSLEEVKQEWQVMLRDLELDSPEAKGWHRVELSRPPDQSSGR